MSARVCMCVWGGGRGAGGGGGRGRSRQAGGGWVAVHGVYGIARAQEIGHFLSDLAIGAGGDHKPTGGMPPPPSFQHESTRA